MSNGFKIKGYILYEFSDEKAEIIEIPEKIKTIREYAFKKCSNLKKIFLSDNTNRWPVDTAKDLPNIEYNIYKSSCITAAFVFNNNFANIYKKDNSLEHNIMLNNLCLEIGFMF